MDMLLSGILIGAVLALTGAGGGILAVPLLVFVTGLPVQAVAPIALVSVGLAAALGAWMGWRQGILRYRAAGVMALGGVIAAPLGMRLSHLLRGEVLGLMMAALMGWVAFQQWRGRRDEAPVGERACLANPRHGRLVWTSSCARALAATGLSAGFLSGLVGVGGGFVIVPGLYRHSDLGLPSIQATSLGVIALVSAGATMMSLGSGQLNWSLALPFLCGAVGALALARRLVHRVPRTHLHSLLALVTMVAAVVLALRSLMSMRGLA